MSADMDTILGYEPAEMVAAFKVREEQLFDEYPEDNATIRLEQLHGLAKGDVFDRFILDLVDRNEVNTKTAVDLIDLGTQLSPGLDRAMVATAISLCFWQDHELIMAVKYAFMAVIDGVENTLHMVSAIDNGQRPDVIINHMEEHREEIHQTPSTFPATLHSIPQQGK